jgi:hypothetical protein
MPVRRSSLIVLLNGIGSRSESIAYDAVLATGAADTSLKRAIGKGTSEIRESLLNMSHLRHLAGLNAWDGRLVRLIGCVRFCT